MNGKIATAHRTGGRVLADQPQGPPLAPGEIVTTGTIPMPGRLRATKIWSSNYGALGIDGLTLRFRAGASLETNRGVHK